MSDRTNVTVIVYDCPEDQRAAALAAIEETAGIEFIESSDALAIGDAYYGNEVSGDFSEEVAAALIEAAPGATFAAWTDPAYDWLGLLVAYAPGLGEYRHDCNANGSAMFSAEEVAAMIAASTAALGIDHDDIGADVRARTGGAWDDAIEAACVRNKAETDARAAAGLAALANAETDYSNPRADDFDPKAAQEAGY